MYDNTDRKRKAGICLVDAVYMATAVSARIIGLAWKDQLEVGYDAGIALLTPELNVQQVIVGGKTM